MKVAPFRALTQPTLFEFKAWKRSRNEGRPFQGIDTRSSCGDRKSYGRNEGRPFQGIDTVNYMQPLLMNIMM